MKKTLLLFLISFGAFSQVFQLDSTYLFETVKKQYNAIYPIVNPLQDTLLNIVYEGNIYADKPVAGGNLLINKDGKLIKTLINPTTPYFDYRNQYNLITPLGKYYRVHTKNFGYTIQRFNQDGSIDRTFNFPIYKDPILHFFLLYDGNIVVNVPNVASTFDLYQIFNEEGKFVKNFQLTDYGLPASAWIKSLLFNESGETYFLIIDNLKNIGEVFKTTKDLVRDETFQKITVSSNTYDISKSTISVNRSVVYLYNANPDETKNSIVKYDNKGKKIWETNFGRISASYSNSFTFYHQQDGSLGLIYMDNKHIRIKADGKIDSVFYENPAQQEVAFLHAFADGTYWVMRNMSGLIEKMYADGSVDANFKISTRLEKTLTPYRIEKQTNNYLVELIDLPPFSTTPYALRIPINATCVRVYNQQHKLLYDFFDSKTTWKTYKTKDALIVRGNGKFYTIDSKSEMSMSIDTLQANDVIDWENQLIYRLLSDNLLARYKIGVGRDNSFRIDLYDFRIYNFQLLANQQIAVQAADNSNYSFFLYNNNGIQTKPQHTLPYTSSNTQSNFNIYSIDDGYLIHSWFHGSRNDVSQSLIKFKKDYTLDSSYQEVNLYAGQFVRVRNDGTVFTNTSGTVTPPPAGYNFLKLLPTGKADSNFILSSLYYTYGFEFFDDNTLYVIGDKGLFRFIKSAETQYFSYNPLPDKITIHSEPVKLNFRTNIKVIKIEVAGNATLQSDSSIVFLPKAGMVSILIKDENNEILAQQKVELIKAVPYFTYAHPALFASSPPYEFKAQSSSGLPVIISAYGKEFVYTMPIDLSMGPYITINLKSEGNEQYENIEETLYFVIQSPLSDEPLSSENNILVYPNPTRDELYIQSNTHPIESFHLIGIKGNEIPIKAEKLGNKYRSSVHNIPHGIYTLLTVSGKKQFIHKIVIE